MSKLCMLYNFAPKYREAIFRAIDNRWDTDWYFGSNFTDIKGLDYEILSNYTELPNVSLFSHWYWQKGAVSLAWNKDYETYFLLGDPHCLSNWILAAYIRLFYGKKKHLYYWTHGWYGKEKRLTRIVKKFYFKMADGIFLYGEYARGLMTKMGFDASKLFVIHNSLDYDKQKAIRGTIAENGIYKNHFGNDNPTLIFIGRLTKVKKLEMLIEAVAKLNESDRPVNVILVGDGTEFEKLQFLSKKLAVESQCWFYGACYDENKNAELIYNADLCVAPGNVGLTAMHSMAFGTPVISHDDFRWQMPEFEAIKPRLTGNFFKKDDLNSLVMAIENWISNHPDREAVRKSCYNEIDNYWTPEYQMSILEKYLTL